MSKKKKEIWDKKVDFKIKSKQKRHHQMMVGKTFEPQGLNQIPIDKDPDINYEKLKQIK